MTHTSALLAASLCWDDDAIRRRRTRHPRVRVQEESITWQILSQRGADAEAHAMPSPFRRTLRLDGRVITIPKRGGRLPPPNRLVEIHGLAGAIGEQLGLAWTAEQDVQRFVATRRRRRVEHQRLVQRSLAELAAYFVLGASHSLANLNLRLLLLNTDAAGLLSSRYPDAKGFPPGSNARGTWRTFNAGLVRNALVAADLAGNPFMARAVEGLAGLHDSTAFQALDQRRGLDYHRRRPQSVEHVSPREALIERLPGLTRFTMPWAALEEEADADRVHEIGKDALEELRVAMRVHRLALPKLIRREGITYVFP